MLEEKPLEEKLPLGLPQGSVRAIIAILLTLSLVGYLMIYKEVAEPILGVVGIVIGYYFGVRQAGK